MLDKISMCIKMIIFYLSSSLGGTCTSFLLIGLLDYFRQCTCICFLRLNTIRTLLIVFYFSELAVHVYFTSHFTCHVKKICPCGFLLIYHTFTFTTLQFEGSFVLVTLSSSWAKQLWIYDSQVKCQTKASPDSHFVCFCLISCWSLMDESNVR